MLSGLLAIILFFVVMGGFVVFDGMRSIADAQRRYTLDELNKNRGEQ